MAHLQAHIPQHIKHIFDDLFAAPGEFPGMEQQQINLRIWRKFGTAVAADRNEGQPLAARGVGLGKQALRRMVMEDAKNFVDQEGVSGHQRAAARPVLEPLLEDAPARRQIALAQFERFGALAAAAVNALAIEEDMA